MGRPFRTYSQDDRGDEHRISADSGDTTSTSGRADWMEEVMEAVADAGIEDSEQLQAVLDWLFSQRRVAYLPDAQPPPASRPLDLLESKVGGKPYLKRAEAWPTNEGQAALAFIWQFRVEQLPRPVQAALGYNSGLLQVFLDEELPGFGEEARGNWFLIRVLTEAELTPRAASEIVPPEDVTVFEEKEVVHFEAVTDYPSYDDLMDHIPSGMDEALARNVIGVLNDTEVLTTASGDKLLGW